MSQRIETDGETAGAQTLRRGLSILKLLARYQAAGGLGVSEVARKLELSKATAVRLTRTLMDEQFVAQDTATRHYQLGPESFAVGLAAEPNYALQRVAAPSLRASRCVTASRPSACPVKAAATLTRRPLCVSAIDTPWD